MGEKIPFIEKPPIMTLDEWRTLYPSTLVLLEDASPAEFDETEPVAETEAAAGEEA